MLDFKTLPTNTILYHPTHGEVKFINFNFGTCIVKKYDLVLYWGVDNTIQQKYDWIEITVKTNLLKELETLEL